MGKKILVFIFLTMLAGSTQAQSFLNWQLTDRYFSLYLGTGRTGYIGDLSNSKPLTGGLGHFNIGIEARLYTRVGARIQATFYKLEGSDVHAQDSSANRQRNLSFKSNNIEYVLQGVYYFHKYGGMYHKRRTYEPFIAAGVGYTTYNPQADLRGITYNLRDLRTEGELYGNKSLIIPVNLGVKAKLNEFMNLTLDLGYRFTFTDYLDDVSKTYGGPFADGTIEASLSNRKDEIPVVNQEAYERFIPGAKRGDASKMDTYFFINFNIEIYLPSDLFKSKGGRVKKEKIIGKPSAY